MKKILIYIISIICIIIIFPTICTKRRKKESEIIAKDDNNIEESEIKQYDYSKYSKIKLYHTKISEIQEIPIDEYLYGVVSAEMPASYEIEALKAQAIVARTYTIYQITHSVRKTSRCRYL